LCTYNVYIFTFACAYLENNKRFDHKEGLRLQPHGVRAWPQVRAWPHVRAWPQVRAWPAVRGECRWLHLQGGTASPRHGPEQREKGEPGGGRAGGLLRHEGEPRRRRRRRRSRGKSEGAAHSVRVWRGARIPRFIHSRRRRRRRRAEGGAVGG